MEKIIHIGDYEIPVRSTAASLFSYKANFGRDGIRDMIALAKGLPEGSHEVTADVLTDSGFDFDVFFRFLWVFAKAANKSIPPLPEWLDTIEMPPFDFAMGALPQVTDLLMSTAKSSVKSKN